MKCRQATGNLGLFRRKFETGIIPTEPGTEEKIQSFTQQRFGLLCARHFQRCWGYSRGQSRYFPSGSYILLWEADFNQRFYKDLEEGS